MSGRQTLWITLIVALLVGAAGGVLVTFLIVNQRMATLQTQLAASEQARISAEQSSTAAGRGATETAGATGVASGETQTATAGTGGTGASEPKPKPKPTTVRQYAFVKKLTASGSSYKMVVDYAEFLTGKAAADAAKAHGDESPPPNDYYIVNDNPLLRTLPVKAGMKVKLYENPDGSHAPNGVTVSLAAWQTDLLPTATNQSIRLNGYWLTITGGTVTAAEEVWVP